MSDCGHPKKTSAFLSRTFLAAIYMAGLVLCVQAQQNASEYQIKSAYLYNFAKMSQWPPGALSGPNSTLTIGVFGGHDEFVDVLRATIAGKAVNGHPIEVRRVRSAEELKSCQIIFFRASERNARPAFVELEHAGILLVGEEKDFLGQGGMINLVLSNGKISYEVNAAALGHAGIRYGANIAAAQDSRIPSNIEIGGSRELKFQKSPVYPAMLQKMNYKGAVQLEAMVMADGTGKEVRVLGGHPLLAQAAVQAVLQWRYEPAGKETVEVVKINFGQ
jgi:TonB family protein